MLRRRLIGPLLAAMVWTSSTVAQGQSPPTIEITFERALALARDQSPTLATARARVHEAASRVDAASVWRFNPQLSVQAGPRFGESETTVDWSVGAKQWFELGGQRADRVQAAEHGVAAGEARRDDTQRRFLRDVSLAFLAVLHRKKRLALAQENQRIAKAVAQVAARRHELGDVGGLEKSVASLSVVRAQSYQDRAEVELIQAEGRLAALLGLETQQRLVAVGDLKDFGIDTDAGDVTSRPDLRALEADARQAEATAELGRSQRIPNMAFGAGVGQEEGEHVVQANLTLALPLFDRGQGVTAVAEARQQRVRAELHAARNAADTEIATAERAAQRLSLAARRFEDGGLATLGRAEKLATATYEAGAIPLGELLAVRRELTEAKFDYADLLLGAAVAQTELAASKGALQ